MCLGLGERVSVGIQTRISVGNLDDLVTPRPVHSAAWLRSETRLFVELSSIGASTHLRPQRVDLSAHFAVPKYSPSSYVAERHARH